MGCHSGATSSSNNITMKVINPEDKITVSQARSLKKGETAFVSFPPTALNPDGEPIIAKTDDGGYRYMGKIPSWDDVKVDTTSDEFKQAQRDYNVTARFYPDGKVEVTKGGLYDRSKSYKSVNDFKKDVTKRIESRRSWDEREQDSLNQGRISQIKAEYYRGIVNKNSSSMAIKKMNEGIRNDMTATKTRLAVAYMAERKIDETINRAKNLMKK